MPRRRQLCPDPKTTVGGLAPDYVQCLCGEVGEQATMFLLDPCGNALEFKAFKDMGQLFAK